VLAGDIEGTIVQWGAHNNTQGSQICTGIKIPTKFALNFNNFQDTILLVD